MDAIINWVGNTFTKISESVISVLPKSPFVYLDTIPAVKDVLGYVNYFVPISQMIGILELWLIGIAGYYISMVILRWVKAVD